MARGASPYNAPPSVPPPSNRYAPAATAQAGQPDSSSNPAINRQGPPPPNPYAPQQPYQAQQPQNIQQPAPLHQEQSSPSQEQQQQALAQQRMAVEQAANQASQNQPQPAPQAPSGAQSAPGGQDSQHTPQPQAQMQQQQQQDPFGPLVSYFAIIYAYCTYSIFTLHPLSIGVTAVILCVYWCWLEQKGRLEQSCSKKM